MVEQEVEKKDIATGLEKLVESVVRHSISPEKFESREMEIQTAKEALVKALSQLGHVMACAAGG